MILLSLILSPHTNRYPAVRFYLLPLLVPETFRAITRPRVAEFHYRFAWRYTAQFRFALFWLSILFEKKLGSILVQLGILIKFPVWVNTETWFQYSTRYTVCCKDISCLRSQFIRHSDRELKKMKYLCIPCSNVFLQKVWWDYVKFHLTMFPPSFYLKALSRFVGVDFNPNYNSQDQSVDAQTCVGLPYV